MPIFDINRFRRLIGQENVSIEGHPEVPSDTIQKMLQLAVSVRHIDRHDESSLILFDMVIPGRRRGVSLRSH